MSGDNVSSPLLDWTNPFLRNMPMVAIVRQEGPKNGDMLSSSQTQSKRVFFRIGNNRILPQPISGQEIMATSGNATKLYGFDNLMELTLE